MSAAIYVYTLANATATPASAVTALLGSTMPSGTGGEPAFENFDAFEIEIDLTAGTGGTTDITLDRSFDNGVTWREFYRTPALAATTTAKYSCSLGPSNTIVAIGAPAAGTTAPVLAVNTCVGGRPGQFVRARATGGAGTTVAGSATVKIIAHRQRR